MVILCCCREEVGGKAASVTAIASYKENYFLQPRNVISVLYFPLFFNANFGEMDEIYPSG